jgi:hypothetical protein
MAAADEWKMLSEAPGRDEFADDSHVMSLQTTVPTVPNWMKPTPGPPPAAATLLGECTSQHTHILFFFFLHNI